MSPKLARAIRQAVSWNRPQGTPVPPDMIADSPLLWALYAADRAEWRDVVALMAAGRITAVQVKERLSDHVADASGVEEETLCAILAVK